MPSSDVDVDSILMSLNYIGWFQITQFMLSNIGGLIIYSNNLIYIFMATLPVFQCRNLTDSQLVAFNISNDINEVEYSQCDVYIRPKTYQNISGDPLTLKCPNGYSYTTPVDKSIISEWDLVCQSDGLAEFSQTIYILGQLIGSIFWPIQVEHFGRRPTHIICNILILPLNLIAAHSPYFTLFTITRFFNGFLVQGYLISATTAIIEMFPAEKRNMMTGLSSVVFSFTILILELTAYLARNNSWRVILICDACFSLLGLIDLIFFKESLRWLFAKGKVEQAKEMMKYVAKMNDTNYDEAWAIAEKDIDPLLETELTDLVETHKIKDKRSTSEKRDSESEETTTLAQESKNGLVKNKDQRKTTQAKSGWIGIIPIMQYSHTRSISFVLMITWLVVTVTYHSFFFLSETLSGNLYLNFLFLCLIEIFSCVFYWAAIVRFGHKKPLTVAVMSGSIFLIVASILKGFGGGSNESNIFFMVFFMLAMFGIGSAFGGLFLYTPELYPTEVRSVGFGLCSAAARVGHMMAPFSRMLAKRYAWAPSTLSGTGCIICATLMIWGLPQTFKRQLPQTLDEMKQIELSRKSTQQKINL